MKMKLGILIFLLTANLLSAATTNLTALLQQGLLEEQGNRNLDAAITDYQSLAARFDQDRQLAATAVFRLGECYRAQGKTNEAAAQYQRILRDFSDQQTLVTLSQQDLAGLGIEGGATASDATAKQKDLVAQQVALAQKQVAEVQKQYDAGQVATSAVREAQQQLLQLQEKLAGLEANANAVSGQLAEKQAAEAQLYDRLKALSDAQLANVLPSLVTDETLNHLLQSRDEMAAKLAELKVDQGTNTEILQKQRMALDQLNVELKDKMQGVLEALKIRAETASEDQAGGAAGASSTAAPADQQQRDFLQKQIELAEKDLADVQKRYQGGQATAGDVGFAEKQLQERQQQLAWLNSHVITAANPAPAAGSEEDREIARIQDLIQNSPDLINAPSDGVTPLVKAAYYGWLKVAAYLLDHGATINTACPKIPGADMVNLKDVENISPTPLIAAIAAGNKTMTQFLIERGADVNFKSENEVTPLYVAAGLGFQAVVEVLLANHAEVNALTDSKRTPLFAAVEKGKSSTAKLLLKAGARVDIVDQSGSTVLFAAISQPADLVAMLLAAGADPNALDDKGRTPLSYAIILKRPQVLTLLLAAKADPNAGLRDGPLLCAARMSDLEGAQLLLAAGANPNVTGKVFVQAGSDFNWNFFNQGQTGPADPLSFAIGRSDAAMVQLLLKYKADPNFCQVNDKPAIFKALSETNILLSLLEGGADANVQSINNNASPAYWTPLAAATAGRQAEAVEILLQHGANPNVPDANGNPPLYSAVSWGDLRANNREIVKLLLDHGANPNGQTRDGKTPLDAIKTRLAQNRSSEEMAIATDIAGELRRHGALDNLPHWDQIAVSRPATSFSYAIFHKGTNDWNRFSLLEAVLNAYASSQTVQIPQGDNSRANYQVGTMLSFPDFTRVTIVRPSRDSTNVTRTVVNLLGVTNNIDVAKDVALKFGDVVEIPERVHSLGEESVGLTQPQEKTLYDYATGKVELSAHGQKTEISIYRVGDRALFNQIINSGEARQILSSASDLSRVKVIRHDSKMAGGFERVLDASGRPVQNGAGTPASFAVRAARAGSLSYQWNLNGSGSADAEALWLRDGDVIEVPDKL